jgi:hypothetical protein
MRSKNVQYVVRTCRNDDKTQLEKSRKRALRMLLSCFLPSFLVLAKVLGYEIVRNSMKLSILVRSETNFMLQIPKIHCIEFEIHPNFPKFHPFRFGLIFFQNESQNLGLGTTLIGPVRLYYKPYFFSQRTMFFSYNKSANSTFSQANRAIGTRFHDDGRPWSSSLLDLARSVTTERCK